MQYNYAIRSETDGYAVYARQEAHPWCFKARFRSLYNAMKYLKALMNRVVNT